MYFVFLLASCEAIIMQSGNIAVTVNMSMIGSYWPALWDVNVINIARMDMAGNVLFCTKLERKLICL